MSTPLVRSADIAALADVSRAAVTQWRKRHKDFPRPVEGSDPDSPLFDRHEVERWLIARGRLPQRPARQTDPVAVAGLFSDHLRGVDGTDRIDMVGAALVAEYLTRVLARGQGLSGAARSLTHAKLPMGVQPPTTLAGIDPHDAATWLQFLASNSDGAAMALSPFAEGEEPRLLLDLCSLMTDIAPESFLKVYDTVLRSDRHQREHIDPQLISTLLADLIDAAGHSNQATVLDPAMGVGSTLLTLGARHRHAELIGVEIDRSTYTTAIRRSFLADRRVDFRLGNSLGADPASGILASIVVSNPPWGLREFGPDVDVHDPRWLFGRPSPRSDSIWLQHTIAHLADEGRGFVVTTRSELSRSGPIAALRHEMLRQGTIEAIIQLPTALFLPFASIETAIWVLARPGQTVDPDRVLLINLPSTRRPDTAVLNQGARRAVDEYKRWRTTGRAAETPFSTVVSVRQLLEPGVGLDPDIWLQQRDAPSPQELIERIHRTRADVEQTSATIDITIPDLVPTGTTRREKLTDLPGVTVIRGIPELRLKQAEASVGAPVLTGKVLHQYRRSGTTEAERYVDTENLPYEFTSRTGDIAVAGVASIGGSPATRIDVDGWVPSSTIFLVRVDPAVPGAPNPDYLVSCINASTTTGHYSRLKDMVRITPSHIEIPVLATTDQQHIADLLQRLSTAAAAAEQHLAHLRELTALVDAAIGTGTVTVKT